MTKPTSALSWATDATFSSGAESGLTTRADPSGIRAQGIKANQRIPARWFNFLLGAVGDWVKWLDDSTVWSRNAVTADGADNTGATDTTSALQDCLDALDAAGQGGVMVLIAGTYKITAALVVPQGVSIKCLGAVYLMLDHATHNWLEYSDGTHDASQPDVVEGLYFGALQANTGHGIDVSTFAAVDFVGCGFNVHAGTPHMNDRFFVSSVDCRVRFFKPVAKFINTQNAFENDTGRLAIFGCDFVGTSSFDGRMIDNLGTGELVIGDGCRFDVGACTSGTVSVVYTSGAGTRTQIDSATFDDGAGNGNTAIEFTDGMLITVSEDVAFVNIVPYEAGATAAAGSRLALVPSIAIDMGSGDAVTIPVYVRSAMVETTNADAPDVTLKKPLYVGQPFDLIVRNNHGSGTWPSGLTILTVDSSYGKYCQASLIGLANGAAFTMRFVAEELPSSITSIDLAWVQVGAVGTIGSFS